jgi:hypothetical protein
MGARKNRNQEGRRLDKGRRWLQAFPRDPEVGMNDVQQVIATGLGTILILAGLALIVLRRDSGANQVKLWNLEVNLSTPALLVLIAGCGLFALPLFVPHRDSAWMIFPASGGGSGSASPGNPLRIKQEILQKESEPNDSPTQANVLPFGATVEGAVGNGEVDYFIVHVPENQKGRNRIIVRQVSNPNYWTVRIFDANEKQIFNDFTRDTVSTAVPPSRLYMIAIEKAPNPSDPGGNKRKYEILVRGDDAGAAE